MYRSARSPINTSGSSSQTTETPAVKGQNKGAVTSSNVSSSSSVAADPDAPHSRGGAKSAPVVIEEYGDYQCPPCGAMHPEIQKIEAEYGEKVRFIFRQFPLTKIHANAMTAAQAAEAAGLQGRFWEMHDMLYQNQAAWSKSPEARKIFTEYARVIGLDVNRFVSDIDSPQVKARVSADQRRGEGRGVTGTPAIFVNGQQIKPEMTTPDGLRLVINYALNQRGL